MKNKPYRELVGSLVYLTNATRPDIAYIANVLSRFHLSLQKKHWMAAKRVIRYLKKTIEYSITYKKREDEIQAYVDSDWANDISDRRSYTGYVITLAGGPVSWSSKKQKSVALSIMEAEYMTLSEVIRELIFNY